MHYRRTLIGLFALSGMCGLIYQVLWVRLLTLTFGVTSIAMSVVLSTFMAGLALGSVLVGRGWRIHRSALRSYAILELIIAATALLVPYAIHWLSPLNRFLAQHITDRISGVHSGSMIAIGLEFLEVGLILLVPTTCMGATLPNLSSYVATRRASMGEDIGELYGMNTLGAFTGTILTGFVLIEYLGLSWTNIMAASINVIVALIAWRMPDAQVDREAGESVAQSDPVLNEETPSWSLTLTLVVAALCGFTSIAYEVLWTRLLSQLLLTTTYVYTLILAIVIGGIGLGSLIGARLVDRVREVGVWFGALEITLGTSILLTFPWLIHFLQVNPRPIEEQTADFLERCLGIIELSVAIAGPASICMGISFPLLVRMAGAHRTSMASVVGKLYSTNTAAGILGAVAASFIFIPTVGTFGSLRMLAAVNIGLGVFALWPLSSLSRTGRAVGAAAALLLLGISLQTRQLELSDIFQARLPPGSKIVALKEGIVSTVMVADQTRPEVRRIWINSAWVAGSGGSHKMLGHLPLLFGQGANAVLGIAFGTGQSFGTTLLHEVGSIDCVDLDPNVVELGGHFFAAQNNQLLSQPQTHVHIQDGRTFVSQAGRRYDAIIMEPLQPWSAGSVNLYTSEFYHEVAGALKPGGVVGQWMPIDDVTADVTRSVVATFAHEFPNTFVFLDNYDLWLVGSIDPVTISPTELLSRMRRARVKADLDSIEYPDPSSILATCVLGPTDIPKYVGAVPLLHDDRPFLEFVAPRMMGGNYLRENFAAIRSSLRFPLQSVSTGEVTQLEPSLVNGNTGKALMDGLLATENEAWVDARDIYRGAYLQASSIGRLRAFYRESTARLARAGMAANHPDEAIQAYEQHLTLDAEFAEGWLNLGLLYGRSNRFLEAHSALQKAAVSESLRPRVEKARQLLQQVEGRQAGRRDVDSDLPQH